MGDTTLSYTHNGNDLSEKFISSLGLNLVRDVVNKAEGPILGQQALDILVIAKNIGWFKPNYTDNPLFPNEAMTFSQRMKRTFKQTHQGRIRGLSCYNDFPFPDELVNVIYRLEETHVNGDVRVFTDINIFGGGIGFEMNVDTEVEDLNREILYGLIDWKFSGGTIHDSGVSDTYFIFSDSSIYLMKLTFDMTGLILKIDTETVKN